jgi:putative ABC transport system substrate-binding protein
MNRRDAVSLFGGAAAAVLGPLGARAEQAVRRIGLLMAVAEGDPEGEARLATFRHALADLGWVEGKNLRIELRWGAGDLERMRSYAAELVALAPDLIVGNGAPATAALQRATKSIPVLFVLVNDPVGQGFIANLARPGGNVTGFTFVEYSMLGKSLELLKELAPRVTRVAVLFSPETAPYYVPFMREFEAAPGPAGVTVKSSPVRTASEVEIAAAELARESGGGLLVAPDNFTVVNRAAIMRVAAEHRLPAIFTFRQFVKEGALMSYGPDSVDIFHRSASYVDRILKGAKPAELPAQSPVKFEFAVNLNTARALGLDAPPMLIALADEVIE